MPLSIHQALLANSLKWSNLIDERSENFLETFLFYFFDKFMDFFWLEPGLVMMTSEMDFSRNLLQDIATASLSQNYHWTELQEQIISKLQQVILIRERKVTYF